MLKYVIGGLLGGGVGYFVFYRIIGCSTGSCPLTANPITATIYGVVLGLLIAGMISSPKKKESSGEDIKVADNVEYIADNGKD